MMLTTLPLDIAYVDENDTVLFYSETKDRIFRRTPAVIGLARYKIATRRRA